MKLLAVGDSFTYGEELSDLTQSWPSQLSQQLSAEVVNLGQPGASNAGILRRTVLNADSYDAVIICWSIFHRTEWADHVGTYDMWPGYLSKINRAANTKHRCELGNYITKYHSDEFLYNQYLLNVIFAQNYLSNQSKKYIMFDAFGNTKERRLGDPTLLNKVVSTYYIGWPDNSIMEWVDGLDNMRAPGGHLSVRGHELVADKVYEYMGNLGWFS